MISNDFQRFRLISSDFKYDQRNKVGFVRIKLNANGEKKVTIPKTKYFLKQSILLGNFRALSPTVGYKIISRKLLISQMFTFCVCR